MDQWEGRTYQLRGWEVHCYVPMLEQTVALMKEEEHYIMSQSIVGQ